MAEKMPTMPKTVAPSHARGTAIPTSRNTTRPAALRGLFRALKTDPKTKGIPIIAVTAYAMSGDEERLRQQGFDDFLAKPLDIHALLGKVRSHLGEGR